MAICSQKERLQAEVQESLRTLANAVTDSIEALRSQDDESLTRLDRELETVLGRKERLMGALRQHIAEHGC